MIAEIQTILSSGADAATILIAVFLFKLERRVFILELWKGQLNGTKLSPMGE